MEVIHFYVKYSYDIYLFIGNRGKMPQISPINDNCVEKITKNAWTIRALFVAGIIVPHFLLFLIINLLGIQKKS